MSSPYPRGTNDQVTNIALLALAGGVVLFAALRAAGSITAWLSGMPEPSGGLAAGLNVITDPLNPGAALGAPGLSPVLYWVVASVLLIVPTVLAAWLWMRWRSRRKKPKDVHLIEGVATGTEVSAAAGRKALLSRAQRLRPSLTRADARPEHVGYLIGRAAGQQVWATVEDSFLLIGPPRQGKGLHIVINAILDSPGPVITTSTRPDNLAVTFRARERRGPVAVFDPQHLAPGVPSGLRWSPVRGCEDAFTAMVRAEGLASSAGFGSVESGGFWQGKTAEVLHCLLHAAAIDGRDARTLFQWAHSPTAARDAVRILSNSPYAVEGWADELEQSINSDPKSRDSIWLGVGLAFKGLADPRVMDAVTPREDELFDPEPFLRENGTLYLLGTAEGAGASGALVAAFIEDVVRVAKMLANDSAKFRLDPPLLLALDEVGNLAPLPSLPLLMAEGGGSGITAMPVLQSLAQARTQWGQDKAGIIWGASIVKIVLGGLAEAKDLTDLRIMFGERDEETENISMDHYGNKSYQRSMRKVPILPEDTIRTMPFGTGIVMLRSTRPMITDLHKWTERPDAARLEADANDVESLIRNASKRPVVPPRT